MSDTDQFTYGPEASQFEHHRNLRKQQDTKADLKQHHYPYTDQYNSLEQVNIILCSSDVIYFLQIHC